MNTKIGLGIDIGNVITAGGNEMFSDDFLQTQEMPDAFESIKRLTSRYFGADRVFLISKCGTNMQKKTRAWLLERAFYEKTGVKPENVLFCQERHEKAKICERLELTHFVDDRMEVLVHMIKVLQPPAHLFLFQGKGEELARFPYELAVVKEVSSWFELTRLIISRCAAGSMQEFPQYLMKVDGQRKFLPLYEAGIAWDSGMVKVECGRYVLERDLSVRLMTDEDRACISDAADEYSASK